MTSFSCIVKRWVELRALPIQSTSRFAWYTPTYYYRWRIASTYQTMLYNWLPTSTRAKHVDAFTLSAMYKIYLHFLQLYLHHHKHTSVAQSWTTCIATYPPRNHHPQTKNNTTALASNDYDLPRVEFGIGPIWSSKKTPEHNRIAHFTMLWIWWAASAHWHTYVWTPLLKDNLPTTSQEPKAKSANSPFNPFEPSSKDTAFTIANCSMYYRVCTVKHFFLECSPVHSYQSYSIPSSPIQFVTQNIHSMLFVCTYICIQFTVVHTLELSIKILF